jgi:DNA-binding MltR family transcriptional regulator
MRRRGVNMAHVYETLRVPEELFDDVEHDVKIAVKKVNARFVIAVFRKDDEIVKVNNSLLHN